MDQLKFKKRLNNIYQQANQRLGGKLDILKESFQTFTETQATRAAAGMTYYTLFSLFPLLIVMVTVVSFFVDGDRAIDQINQVMTTAIPVSTNLVEKNIQRVLDLRNSVGLFGLVGFVWSASNAFTMLADNINQAFPKTEFKSFVRKRLVALAILGTIIVLLVLLMFSSTLLNLISQFKLPFLRESNFFYSSIGVFITYLSPWLISFILFTSLYRWVPESDVRWKSAVWSGFIVMFVWRLTSIGFSWYLSSGLTSYELVYGSLSAIVILLFWIYVSSLIIFFGAHLCASINRYIEKE